MIKSQNCVHVYLTLDTDKHRQLTCNTFILLVSLSLSLPHTTEVHYSVTPFFFKSQAGKLGKQKQQCIALFIH